MDTIMLEIEKNKEKEYEIDKILNGNKIVEDCLIQNKLEHIIYNVLNKQVLVCPRETLDLEMTRFKNTLLFHVIVNARQK